MKKLSIVLLVLFSSQLLAAGGTNIELQSANINLENKASLQRGAKYFVNYYITNSF